MRASASCVEIKEDTDSHGLPTVTVKLDDGAVPGSRVAFVRTLADRQFATDLVTPEKFASVYAGNPPETRAGRLAAFYAIVTVGNCACRRWRCRSSRS